MSHYGERLTALVDGQLAPSERDRLLVHVAGCPSCRGEVEALRRVKVSLCSSASPPLSPALLARLATLAEPTPVRPRPPSGPRPTPSPSRSPAPPPGRSARSPRPGIARQDRRRPEPRRYRTRSLAMGAVSLAVLTLGTAFVAGGAGGGNRVPLAPPVEVFAVEPAQSGARVAVVNPVIGSANASFGAVSNLDFGRSSYAGGVVPRR